MNMTGDTWQLDNIAEEFIAQSFQNAEIRRAINNLPSEFEELFIARTKCKIDELLLVIKLCKDAGKCSGKEIIEFAETIF